jgi:hypothetical protein
MPLFRDGDPAYGPMGLMRDFLCVIDCTQDQGLAPLFPQQIFIRVFTRTAEGKFAP